MEEIVKTKILNDSSDLIVSIDTNFNLTSFNPSYQQFFKRYYQKDLVPGMSVKDALSDYPKDLRSALVSWEKALKDGNFTTLKQMGEEDAEYYEISFFSLKDGDNLLGAAHIGRNVTERIKSEKELREREERYHLLSKSSNDAIYEWNLSSGKFWWNDGIYNLFGYNIKEVEPDMRWWFSRIHDNDREKLLESINEKIKEEISFWVHEYKFQRADGLFATIYDRGYVMYNDSWQPIRVIGAMTDITERKRTEEALQQREKQFRSLLKNSSDIISIINSHGVFSYTSPSVKKILGYEADELVNIKRTDLIHPDDLQDVNDALKNLFSNPADIQTVLNRLKHKSGHYVLLESTYNNLLNDPYVKGIVINSRDITERIATQNALKQSEATLKQSQKIAKMGNWEFHVVNNEMFWSEEMYFVMKRNLEAGIPTFEEVLHSLLPEDIAILKEAFGNAVERGMSYNIDYGRRVNGSVQYINSICNPVFDKKGKLEKLVGISMDITSRKEVEERLSESELWFKTIFNTSRDGFVVELDERIFYVNDALVSLFGYKSQGEILGRKTTSIFIEEDSLILSEYSKRRLSGYPIPDVYETRGLRKDGNVIDVEVSVSVFELKGVNYIIGLLRDITERKLAEQKLKEQNEELKKINSELDRFVYSASHDLRAPLVSVLGLINVLKLNENEAEKLKYLDLIIKSINKLDRFIQDIIHHSRNSRIEIQPEEVNFQEIITETFEDLKYLEGADTINLKIDIKEKIDFYSDPRRIAVVFNNLISNAIRYGLPTLRPPEIEIQIVADMEKATIKIRDNGQGIAPEHIDKIFEMFYRASEKNVGSGLGLYIVKETLAKLGGSIKASSELNKGTTFEIVLPNQKRIKTIN